jgi:hypothetical protein
MKITRPLQEICMASRHASNVKKKSKRKIPPQKISIKERKGNKRLTNAKWLL